MATFSIKLQPGFEKKLQKFVMPDGLAKIVRKEFVQSFNESYRILVDNAIENSQIMEDLENGTIAAIFGMDDGQKTREIERFRELFRAKAINVKLTGNGLRVSVIIGNNDIKKLVVRHNVNVPVSFNWLEILIKGLEGDEINAKIMKLIGVQEYVEASSITDITRENIIKQHSRSGRAIMIVPNKKNRKDFGRGPYHFRIIPNPNLLTDMFDGFTGKLEKLITKDFQGRLKKISFKA